MNNFKSIISQLPKSELHIHLRGAMPINYFYKIFSKYFHDWNCESEEYKEKFFSQSEYIKKIMSTDNHSINMISKLFEYKSFEQFLATYSFTGYFVKTIEDFKQLIIGVLEYLKLQKIIYAEITISITGYQRIGITLEDIKKCLESTEDYPGIKVQWIVDLVRNYGQEMILNTLKKVIDLKCKNIIGITLGGNENIYPNKDFIEVFKIAKEAGLHTTIHSGEMRGPESVWEAINIFELDRIGHGVRAIEDKTLVKYLAEKQIPLEVCPTSNIKTGIYKDYNMHPLWDLYNEGAKVTINSDDPTFFNTTLNDEYLNMYRDKSDFDKIISVLKNGFNYSFLSSKEVNKYLTIFDNQLNSILD